MDLDAGSGKVDKSGAGTVDNSAGSEFVTFEETVIQEPRVGMEFDSEDAAKEFYDGYARRVGFVMRLDQCRRSEVDKRILSRRLSCNKQGYYAQPKDHLGPARKQRTSTREGCNAMMLVKLNPSGKWVVTRFEKEHTHTLVISDRLSRNDLDSKERKIQALTQELKRQTQLCDLYRQELIAFIESLEDQTETISTKVKVVVNHIRDFEAEQIQNQSLLQSNNLDQRVA